MRDRTDFEIQIKRCGAMAVYLIIWPLTARETRWTESRNFLYSNAERDARHRVGFHSRSTIVLGRGSAAMCRTDRPEASAFISRLFSSATGQPARVDSDSGGWLLECPTRLLYLLAYIIIRAFADAYLPFLPLCLFLSLSEKKRARSFM